MKENSKPASVNVHYYEDWTDPIETCVVLLFVLLVVIRGRVFHIAWVFRTVLPDSIQFVHGFADQNIQPEAKETARLSLERCLGVLKWSRLTLRDVCLCPVCG